MLSEINGFDWQGSGLDFNKKQIEFFPAAA